MKQLSRNMQFRVDAEFAAIQRIPLHWRAERADRTDKHLEFIDSLVPAGDGERRADAREAARTVQQVDLYAHTPRHPMTRQQIRHARQRGAIPF